jgi:hypothetical protein
MTVQTVIERSDNSADVDFATIQESVSGYLRNSIEDFSSTVKDHPRIAIAAGVAVLAGMIALSAAPVVRALKDRELIAA